ncbi:FAD-binding dehydrogenase [Acrocarpospora pleiomorpha]|uniref:FAD-binding dehydrogenase n=1 Tax=Acrocarpospora pleiomorpha TaxID=90975 RepID=A0A5M3XJ83_9ACTN|nr:FAD-binding protein [Acrocarpospora pleiomorpha]GES21314.1 FAD-binding dehydrogenase [Acrocarpospora pleiomorpha]
MYHTGPYDRTVDVVVLGFGDAGAVAAITAHDAGAEVLVIEKQQARDHRPNSRYAAGFFLVPTDVERAIKYLTALYAVNDETVDPELIRTWATETAANPAWLDSHGCGYAETGILGEHHTVPGHDAITVYKAKPGPRPLGYTGCPMHGFLRHLVAERGIEVQYGTAARWLLTDERGAVTGVQTEHERIGVRRGVVLAVGGYEASKQLKTQYLPVGPVHFYGTEHNTGDGITMAVEVGAELWHMNVWPGHFVARFPGSGYSGGTAIDLWGSGRFGPAEDSHPPGSIFVDGSARRFLPEPGPQHAAHLELLGMNATRLSHPRVPTWWIFDQARFDAATLVPTYSGPAGPIGDFTWSPDNTAELRRGWILSADSAAELALRCELDPLALEATIDRYNDHCADGVDADFGRDPATLTPLHGPRYFAVPLWPGGSHTLGGPRRDAASRVASVRGGFVENLYAAGELGSLHGLLYPAGGGSIAECLAFGRIAGRNAAANMIVGG